MFIVNLSCYINSTQCLKFSRWYLLKLLKVGRERKGSPNKCQILRGAEKLYFVSDLPVKEAEQRKESNIFYFFFSYKPTLQHVYNMLHSLFHDSPICVSRGKAAEVTTDKISNGNSNISVRQTRRHNGNIVVYYMKFILM